MADIRTKMETNGHVKYLKPVFHVTRDMSHLQRWQVKLWPAIVQLLRCLFELGFPVLIDKDGARLEILSIADTDAIATAIVAATGGESFYIPEVPRNLTLPKTNVIFGGNRAPYSDSAALYESVGKRPDKVIGLCPITRDPCVRHEYVVETIKRSDVEALYKRIKTLAAS